MESCWDGTANSNISQTQRLAIERTLNFTTMPQEEDDFGYSRKKVSRDPMSHRIIEKRRRDRMNNCLADLSRLIPTVYLKKGRGRIEKTEIIEMATKHLRHLQAHACKDPATCEVVQNLENQDTTRQHRMGYQECTSETVRFLVEAEGFYPNEGVCLRLINHLHEHYEKLVRAGCYGQNRTMGKTEDNGSLQMEVECISKNMGDNSIVQPPLNNAGVKRSITPCSEHLSRDSVPMFHDVELAKSYMEARKNQSLAENGDSMEPEPINEGRESSQLRDILKCPTLPQKRMRSNSTSSSLSNVSSYYSRPVTSPAAMYCASSAELYAASRAEEVYKFKNNIKERFNADLNHNKDDRNVRIMQENREPNTHSLQAETHKLTIESRTGSTGFDLPIIFSSPNGFKTNRLSKVSAITTMCRNKEADTEHCVKVTERHCDRTNNNSDVAHLGHRTDAQMDSSSSSSSCGSNPSPNSNSHFNGSTTSSGYSTERPSSPMPKAMKCELQPGPQSPGSPVPYLQMPQNYSEAMRSQSPKQMVRTLVPVFALHPKGSFYIPLTLDMTLLAPYFADSEESSLSMLHPVSISVNFCRQFKLPELRQTGAWSKDSMYGNYNDRDY